MLGKLIRHEFRATRRMFLPVLAAPLVLAVPTRFSMHAIAQEYSLFARQLLSVLTTFFRLSILACLLMSLVVMVQRFRRNLLSDEGYLMFTLPVSIHALLWSKLIVSVVWFIVTYAVCTLSLFITMSSATLLEQLGTSLHGLFTSLPSSLAAIAAEALLVLLLGCSCVCLIFYAALATGHSFARHRWLSSVLCFFVLWVLGQISGISMIVSWLDSSRFSQTLASGQTLAIPQMTLLLILGGLLVFSALLYLLTWFMLRRRLNLE